jgi:hypothetical protein
MTESIKILSPFSFRVFQYNGVTYSSLISCLCSLSVGEPLKERTGFQAFIETISCVERKQVSNFKEIVKAWVESSNLIKKALSDTLDFPISGPIPEISRELEAVREELKGRVFGLTLSDQSVEFSDIEFETLIDFLHQIRKRDGQTSIHSDMILDLVYSVVNKTSGTGQATADAEKMKEIMKMWEKKLDLERYPNFKRSVIEASKKLKGVPVDSVSKVSIGICEYFRNFEERDFHGIKILFLKDFREYRRRYVIETEDEEELKEKPEEKPVEEVKEKPEEKPAEESTEEVEKKPDETKDVEVIKEPPAEKEESVEEEEVEFESVGEEEEPVKTGDELEIDTKIENS